MLLGEGVQQSQDVWQELFGTVRGLEETVELALQAFAPDPPDKVMAYETAIWLDFASCLSLNCVSKQVVSATTKKRLLIKSLQGLQQGKDGIQVQV